jgi:hypothetical protein
MASRALALIAVMLFLFMGAAAIDAQRSTAVRGTGDQTTITNETFSPAADSTITLSESNRNVSVYGETVDVYQNGATIVPEGNYTWNVGNGTITIPSGTGLNTSETANITYGYYDPTGEQSVITTIATLGINFGDEVFYLLAFSFIVAFAALFRGAM